MTLRAKEMREIKEVKRDKKTIGRSGLEVTVKSSSKVTERCNEQTPRNLANGFPLISRWLQIFECATYASYFSHSNSNSNYSLSFTNVHTSMILLVNKHMYISVCSSPVVTRSLDTRFNDTETIVTDSLIVRYIDSRYIVYD